MPSQGVCKRCNYISSQDLCKACVLLEGLNKGLPKLGIGKSSKVKGHLERLKGNETESNTKSGCCGGNSSCKKEMDLDQTQEDCCANKKGRRSSDKQKKAKERNMNNIKKTTAPPNLSEMLNFRDGQDENEDAEGDDDDYQLDFFGCGGGFSESKTTKVGATEDNEDEDEVGTMASKIAGDDIDIENLAELASTMLHFSRGPKP